MLPGLVPAMDSLAELGSCPKLPSPRATLPSGSASAVAINLLFHISPSGGDHHRTGRALLPRVAEFRDADHWIDYSRADRDDRRLLFHSDLIFRNPAQALWRWGERCSRRIFTNREWCMSHRIIADGDAGTICTCIPPSCRAAKPAAGRGIRPPAIRVSILSDSTLALTIAFLRSMQRSSCSPRWSSRKGERDGAGGEVVRFTAESDWIRIASDAGAIGRDGPLQARSLR